MFFQMLVTSVSEKQLGPGCSDTPSCHLGLCLWPAKGSANVLPICHQGWHGRDLFSWFGWSWGFSSRSCLSHSYSLPLVKSRLHIQSYHLWLQNQPSPVKGTVFSPSPSPISSSAFGGSCTEVSLLWSKMIEASFPSFKRKSGNAGPFLSSFMQDFVKMFSSHRVQYWCLSDLKVLLVYPDTKRKT